MGTMEKVGISVAIGLGTALVSLAGVAVHKLNGLSKKFNKSVRELEETTIKDIQQTVVQTAVENAAKSSVNDYMRDVHNVVLSDARAELKKEASAAVEDARKDIREKVTAEISEAASKIDMIELKREVRDKAEQKVLAKFDDNLQDVVDKFGRNIGAVSNIYSTIANDIRRTVSKDDDGKVKLTLG